jgi:NADPH:quinone reductase-like Zn-dependent oxidoreductase
MAVSWPTALAALRPLGRLAAGETVLIHAAAGGTGQAALRMAKHYGATVIAAAAPGLNIGTLIQAAPSIFGEVMGEMFGLLAAGVLGPARPTVHPLEEGPKVLTELGARETVGKLALLPGDR